MIDYFSIPMFNALFIPVIGNYGIGILEIILSVILFNTILILRTSVLEYTNASPLPKWNRRLAQLGLYLHGMLSTLVFSDGIKSVYDTNAFQDPRVFLVLFMIGVIAIKGPALYRAYMSLFKHKKFLLDWQRGFFI